MVMLYFSNIMLTSIENLSHVGNNATSNNIVVNNNNNNVQSNSNTNTIKHSSNAGGVELASANGQKPVAKAVLICHPNSHSFADRSLLLDKPIKIGRSVGHNKTAASNGIFDCKVLSRNHALLWFEEGKFWLRDTRSSNGTFVNAERLSKSSEESAPREVFSGDTVQFGVDVVENSRNVTHGCVIATLKLLLPGGREAKPAPTVSAAGGHNGRVALEDLYHLNQYLQESLQREQMLEAKLAALQTLMKGLRDSTELGWKALISNNSLLSRVELLEVQLKCYSKKFAEDGLREELRVLHEDKNAYESVVKQYFQKILDEKMEATQQCQDLERALADTRLEFANAQSLLSGCQAELRELAAKNTQQEKTIDELEAKLRLCAEKSDDTIAKMGEQNAVLYERVASLTEAERALHQTIGELETHGDYAHKQVMSLQSQLEELQKRHSDILCELVDPALVKDKINDAQLVRSWIRVYAEALRKCAESTAAVRKRAEHLRCDKQSAQQKAALLECELQKCAVELHECREEQAQLEAKIVERSGELQAYQPIPDILDELHEKKCGHENELVDLQEQHKLLNVIQRDIAAAEAHCGELERLLKAAKDELVKVTVSHAIEEDKLELYEKQSSNLETAVRTLEEHVRSLDTYQREAVSIEDVQSLKKQLSEAHETAQQRRHITVALMKHFARFVDSVSAKLDAVEATVAANSAVASDQSLFAGGDHLHALKAESSRLVDAVAQLCSAVENVAGLGYRNAGDDGDDDRVGLSRSQLLARQLNDDLVVAFKEKLRCLEADNQLLQCSLAALQQRYDYLKSYPYFDLYFVLPVVLFVLFCAFNFADKLSFVFGTWG